MSTADFRSDTVTQPTASMRRAMAEAEVGDDVYQEDPTVRRLEERAAELVGQDAALFVPTGSMGNQIAVHLHTSPGDEVLMEADGHTMQYELGAMAALSGAMPRPLSGERGILDEEQVRGAVRPAVYYLSRVPLLILENTHNMAGGVVWPIEHFEAVVEEAREQGLRIHLDGARLFNAAAAAEREASDWGQQADSVMFCLSKGLGAPVGSMLCGSPDFIEEARRVRKMFGGGMRQVGVLAAAGLVALDEGIPRLAEDHALARSLAEGLGSLDGVRVRPVETNIVVVDLDGISAPRFVGALAEHEVKAGAVTSDRVRFVTHRDVGPEHVERAVEAARGAMA